MLINQITSKDWSLSTAEQGAVVQGLNDISQCIAIIITTAKGSDPLRPEFGCDVKNYVDMPTQNVPPMIRAMIAAIETWEKRIQVTKISYKLDVSSILFKIEWKTNAGLTGSTNVNI